MRKAIFSQLPSRSVFELQVHEIGFNIDTVDNPVLDGILAGTLTNIVSHDFIKNQFDLISEQITARRNNTALIRAQRFTAFETGFNATLAPNTHITTPQNNQM